jgi:hypothetical protein
VLPILNTVYQVLRLKDAGWSGRTSYKSGAVMLKLDVSDIKEMTVEGRWCVTEGKLGQDVTP